MVIRLDIEIWEIGEGGTKRGCGKRGGWVGWGRDGGLLGFVVLVCVWVYFCCCSGGCLCRVCKELELCVVDAVG
jgi:hypothetical protein